MFVSAVTPHDLAEKIIHDLDIQDTWENQVMWIESLLTEALVEAKQEELNKRILIAQVEIDRHKAAAFEEAAKIAEEDHNCFDPYSCHASLQADKIRHRAK